MSTNQPDALIPLRAVCLDLVREALEKSRIWLSVEPASALVSLQVAEQANNLRRNLPTEE